jgi:predicted MFS family arabinose efflux permease
VFAVGAVMIVVVALASILWTSNTPPDVAGPNREQAGNHLQTVFRNICFWRIAPLTFFAAGTLLAFQGLWAGPYLFDVMRLTEIEVGNLLLLMGIGVSSGFVLSGWFADRFGLARIIAIASTGFVLCQFALVFAPPLAVVRFIYMLFGFFGAFNIMLLAHARQAFPSTITGQAVTAVNLFGIGGTFLLQWWMGLIISAFIVDTAGHYPPQAYSAALLFTATGTLLTLIWYLPLLRRG